MQVTLAAVAVQCVVQGLVAHSVAAQLWWQTEWVRGQLRVNHPLAAYAQRLPQPGWQSWVPSTATAVLVTVALMLLALLVVRVGRGWWLLLVAALPLVPMEPAAGVWAPPPVNQVAYALLWPAGATAPSTTWAWIAAAITALMVAIPAATLNAMAGRRPWTSGPQILGRLLPAGSAAGLVLAWEAAAGWTPDPWPAGWRATLTVVGALVLTGTLDRRIAFLPVAVLPLAVLPALAAGAVRWTTGPDGLTAVVIDPLALWMSAAALAGGVVGLTQPVLTKWLRRAWSAWREMLAADVAAYNGARAGAVAAGAVRAAHQAADQGGAAQPDGADTVPAAGDMDNTELDCDRLVGVSRRPSHAAPARVGGRHRA